MSSLKHVKIFADGADLDGILELYKNPSIKGFTTNPTLMRKAGIADYEAFARQLLEAIPDRPISFEVFADDFDEMIAQGRVIASWGDNVNVKIPVTDDQGRVHRPGGAHARQCRRKRQRDRDHDRRAGASGSPRASAPNVAGDRVGFCRPRRGHRPRPGADHARLAARARRAARKRS